jgi:hypothetical protein
MMAAATIAAELAQHHTRDADSDRIRAIAARAPGTPRNQAVESTRFPSGDADCKLAENACRLELATELTFMIAPDRR